MTSLFHGSALVEVDPEGNADLPEFVAEALEDADLPELLVGKHEADACLVGYDRDHLNELRVRAERRRLADEEAGRDARSHYHRSRHTFGIVEKLPRTGARLRIPAAMRHLGRIGSLALFVGAGDSFEIWNPALAMESEDEQFRDLAAFRMQNRNSGAGAPPGVQ